MHRPMKSKLLSIQKCKICSVLNYIIICCRSSTQEHPSFEVVSDVKSQLRVFEQIDEVERKHREAREREMLMRVAKVCRC